MRPHVLSVCYVPFWTDDDRTAYGHAIVSTHLSDGSHYIEAIGGAEYAALCDRYGDADGLVHDRTAKEHSCHPT